MNNPISMPLFDLLILNGCCVTGFGIHRADIGVKNERITAIGDLKTAKAIKILDAEHLHILPGLIDTQVHFRDPGFPEKESIKTGSRAALRGGVTCFFDMPNTNPPTIDAEALSKKYATAQRDAFCDFGFFIGGNGQNTQALAALEKAPSCVGVKIFMGSSTGTLLVEEEASLEDILQATKRRIAVHAEDEARLRQRFDIAKNAKNPTAHPEWRDSETALMATKRLIFLAEKLQRSVHVLHISTEEELPFLAEHKKVASCEITPQHLSFTAPECYERLGSFVQMNPPIRSARHQKALWGGVRAGLFDSIGSDHAPHTIEQKKLPYPKTPSGMPGVQTLLPIMLDHVSKGRLSLERFVDLSASGPARLFAIAGKGRIAVGYDADLAIIDLKAEHRITNHEMESQCGWTPYDGVKVTGWPVTTLLRGNIVMREGHIIGEAIGKAVISGL